MQESSLETFREKVEFDSRDKGELHEEVLGER